MLILPWRGVRNRAEEDGLGWLEEVEYGRWTWRKWLPEGRRHLHESLLPKSLAILNTLYI